MTTLQGSHSAFPESDWDTRLDNMLADLETGTNKNGGIIMPQQQQQFAQQQMFSSQQFSSSQQQHSYSYSSHQQSSSSTSSRSIQQQNANQQFHNQLPAPNYSINKSMSSSSLKDSAGGVLRNLEDGLVKSSHYIQENHGKISGPEGTQEWHEVKQGEDPGEFNLERQVRHMMPNVNNTANNDQRYQQQQQQYTAYKVQSNQYSGAGERIQDLDDDDDRPGSRLKQNIDELDTLLYDLNHARNISPDGGPDYTVSSQTFGLDSDDYSETVGKEGHVKRTVHAFNEYSSNMSATDVAKKPPSPSPRRKGPSSPPTARRGAPPQTQTRTQTSTQSYRIEQNTSSNQQYGYPHPNSGPGGQPFAYTPESHPPNPDPGQPSYYTKYNAVKQQNTTRTVHDGRSAPFPQQPARSPTPQNPPKRIDDLMSEFHEFDSVNKGGSPTPAMFCKPSNTTLEVTELPDGPAVVSDTRLEPAPVIREPSPIVVKPTSPKGPEIYYPPGSDFSRTEPAPKPAPADCGSMSLQAGGKGKMKASRYEKGEESDKQQGAAVIPICLPLCCAAPCVIL